jgi:hypothetical protein
MLIYLTSILLFFLQVTSLAKQLKQSEDVHAKKVDKMTSLLQKQTAHISNLQDQLETSVLDHTVHHTGHLTIEAGEGLFVIHVNSLHLSPEGLGSIMKEVRHLYICLFIFIFLPTDFAISI